jgi:hypothetical protein
LFILNKKLCKINKENETMTDNTPAKRPVVLILSVTSLIATFAIAGYFYLQQQKSVDNGTTASPLKTSTSISSLNAIKTPTTAEVLTALFGVKTTSAKVANTADQLSSLWFEQSFEQNKNKFHAVFIKTQNIDPDSKEVMASHADSASISVVVYQWVAKQWQLFSKQTNVGNFGSWGDVPETKQVKTLQLSPDNIAFLIDSGSTGQGYTEDGKGLFSYNPKNKTWKDLGFVQTGGDNAGACDDSPQPADSMLSACWKFSGEITLTKAGKNPDFPDLLVKQKGTTSDDNNKIVLVSDRLYIFNGEQYVEAEAEAR